MSTDNSSKTPATSESSSSVANKQPLTSPKEAMVSVPASDTRSTGALNSGKGIPPKVASIDKNHPSHIKHETHPSHERAMDDTQHTVTMGRKTAVPHTNSSPDGPKGAAQLNPGVEEIVGNSGLGKGSNKGNNKGSNEGSMH